MPTCRTGRKRWALAAATLALLFPAPGRAAEPAVVESVEYQGAKHLKDDELSALSGVRKGEPVNPAKNKAACRKIVARLHEDGRPLATCDLLAGGDGTDTRVVFNITEGPKFKILDIKFAGNRFVRTAALEARLKSTELWARLAAPYDPEAVEKGIRAIEDFYRSFGFREVRVSRDLQWVLDCRGVVLLFHIEEGPRSRPTQPAGAEPIRR